VTAFGVKVEDVAVAQLVGALRSVVMSCSGSRP
jgi:hypothetical protein